MDESPSKEIRPKRYHVPKQPDTSHKVLLMYEKFYGVNTKDVVNGHSQGIHRDVVDDWLLHYKSFRFFNGKFSSINTVK